VEPANAAVPTTPGDDPKLHKMRIDIVEALRQCYDPEIPVNIVDLGLIYQLDILPEGRVNVNMTLTAVGCPVAGWMQEQVRDKVLTVEGVREATVNVIFDPPWDTKKLTPEGREQLLAMGFPV
jgi:metal-sulfur cluster biosynthetic enzyme